MIKAATKALLLLTALCVFAAPAAAENYYQGKTNAKYVFLFIGDGMGMPQIGAAEMYLTAEQGKKSGEYKLLVNTFPAQGVTTTFAADRFITGSAASATAIGCGTKTNIGVIGMDEQLRPVKSLAHLAKEAGKKVGIVSSVSIDHATPAAFYAHTKSRSNYHDINWQMADSGFDYFGGGGLKDPVGKRVLKKGGTPHGDAFKKLAGAGYKVVTKKDEFMAVKPGQKLVAYNAWLQDSGALPYQIDTREEDISLSEFTAKGIELLDNDKGFFMMVEAGKIDWACHANDATSAIIDTVEFMDSIQAAIDFAKKHPKETLIVVTGDHECGGLSLGFAGTKYDTAFDKLAAQQGSYVTFEGVVNTFKEMYPSDREFSMMKDTIENYFGIKMADLTKGEYAELENAFWLSMGGAKSGSKDKDTYALYGGYDPLTVKLTQLMNQKAGLSWTSFSHTGVPVATVAMGPGEESFNGYYDNIDIAKKIMAIMGVKPNVYMVENNDNVKVAAQ